MLQSISIFRHSISGCQGSRWWGPTWQLGKPEVPVAASLPVLVWVSALLAARRRVPGPGQARAPRPGAASWLPLQHRHPGRRRRGTIQVPSQKFKFTSHSGVMMTLTAGVTIMMILVSFVLNCPGYHWWISGSDMIVIIWYHHLELPPPGQD
jgi:hypothetical protein